MIWLFVALLAVIVAAFVGMLWLRRVSDRAWEERQRRELLAPATQRWIEWQVALVDSFTPAMQEVGRQCNEIARVLEPMGDRIRRAMRESLADLPDYRKDRG